MYTTYALTILVPVAGAKHITSKLSVNTYAVQLPTPSVKTTQLNICTKCIDLSQNKNIFK